MNRSLLLAFLTLGIAFCALTSTAYAQASRTWVSGVGDDANPCSRTAPCKTWAGAISKTAVSGEIDALDPGGFGAVTITKSITLDGGGGQVASVLVAGTNGIVVAAGSSDVVTIRNIHIQGLVGGSTSPGLNGISFSSGSQLNVENCYIQSFGQYGIYFTSSGTSFLNVTNSTIDSNQGGGIAMLNTGASSVRASIAYSNILNNTTGTTGAGPGVNATASTVVTLYNSVVSQNQAGILANGGAIMVFGSAIINNQGNGINAINSGNVAVSDSTISFNRYFGVLANTGGAIQSFGNNALFGNASGPGGFNAPGLTPMIYRRFPPH